LKPALLLVCGACLIWLTLTRNNAWKTEITLWEDVARRHPGNIRAWANLSAYYRGAGQMERAMQALRNALSLYPEPGNFVSLGDLMAESERPGEALGAYKEAVVRAERDPLSEEDSRIVKKRAYFGMGNLAVREGDFKKAEGYFRRALEADG
jgi:Tfp pilus assembly protein PilF